VRLARGPTGWSVVGLRHEGGPDPGGLVMARSHAAATQCAVVPWGMFEQRGVRANLDKSATLMRAASQRDVAWYDANRAYQKSAADDRACLAANSTNVQACESKRLLMETDERVLQNTSAGNVGVTVSGR